MQSPAETVDGGRPRRTVGLSEFRLVTSEQLKNPNRHNRSMCAQLKLSHKGAVGFTEYGVCQILFPAAAQRVHDEKHQQTDQCQQSRTVFAVAEGCARAEEAMI